MFILAVKKIIKNEKAAKNPEIAPEEVPLPFINSSIKTTIDGLLDYINEKGRITIKDASAKFHVPEKKIEEWAAILEENDLIKINYSLFAKPLLEKKGLKNDNQKLPGKSR